MFIFRDRSILERLLILSPINVEYSIKVQREFGTCMRLRLKLSIISGFVLLASRATAVVPSDRPLLDLLQVRLLTNAADVARELAIAQPSEPTS